MQIDEGVDIVCPDIKVVNGSRYRVLVNTNIYSQPTSQKESPAEAPDTYEDEPNTCKRDESFKPEKAKTQYTQIEVPQGLHKYVVGKGGSVKRDLERESGTTIDVPGRHREKETNHIRVMYKSEDALASLQLRVERLLSSARRREAPTHFVCIPIRSEEIGANLKRFREKCKLDDRMVQIESKLHLTIGVLKCFSQDEVKKASEVLTSFASKVPYLKRGKPLRAEMRGLEIMNDDPSAANVLYAEVHLSDESTRLQELADACLEAFVDAGMMSYEQNRNCRDVKLHCTLVNTRWKQQMPRQTVDVREMLSEEWEVSSFGKCVLEKVDLNEMTTDRNKCYITAASIPLV